MANTRKVPKGTVVVNRVRMPYDEWLEGLIDYTEEKGTTECQVCGHACKCISIRKTEIGGLDLVWKCLHDGHVFTQHAKKEMLMKWYEQKKSTKRIEEVVYLSKYRKSELPARLRALV
jgi:hypothetical protein